MEFYSTRLATITYNKEINTVEVIWNRIDKSEEYQEVFTKGMEALKYYDSPNWLSDTTRQGLIPPSDRIWMEITILPVAIKNGLRNIAIVLPDDIFKKHYLNNIKKIAEKDQLSMQYFASIEGARQWHRENIKPSKSA